jgi:hypothetical protein
MEESRADTGLYAVFTRDAARTTNVTLHRKLGYDLPPHELHRETLQVESEARWTVI